MLPDLVKFWPLLGSQNSAKLSKPEDIQQKRNKQFSLLIKVPSKLTSFTLTSTIFSLDIKVAHCTRSLSLISLVFCERYPLSIPHQLFQVVSTR